MTTPTYDADHEIEEVDRRGNHGGKQGFWSAE